MRIRLLILSLSVLLVGFGIDLAVAEETSLNIMCPVMTGEEADPNITVEYRGKRVALCCKTCMRKFQANPEKYLHLLPQFASVASTGGGSVDSASPADSNETPAPLLGRLHPALVHFPIAGLPLALLGFVLYAATRQETFARADVPPLLVAGLFAVAAFFSGDAAEDAAGFTGDMHELVEKHELVATIVMWTCLALIAVRLWRWRGLTGAWRAVYGVGLVAATALAAYTGFLGGSLVFGPDHLRF